MKTLRFVLASSSQRRIEILSWLGLNFEVCPHKYHEPKIKNHCEPEKFVIQIAENKAKSLKEDYKDYIIIGCDTIVVLGNEIIGKPQNKKEAEVILRKLSNTKHKVLSGLCLYYPKKSLIFSGVEESIVYTNKLSEKQIKILSAKHLDKAGSYAVQQKNDRFVKKIIGCYYNVVGFPLKLFLDLYSKLILKLSERKM